MKHAPPSEPPRDSGQGRRLLRNVASITVGKVVADVGTFAFFVVISRQFGREGIGGYSVAMAWTGIFVVLGNFGLGDLLIKTISRRSEEFGTFVGQVLWIYGLTVLSLVAVFSSVLPWLPIERELKSMIALIGIYNALYAWIAGMRAVFTAREEMHLGALLEMSLRLTTAALGISLALSGQSLVVTVASMPAMTALHVILGFLMLTHRYGRPKLALNLAVAWRTLRDSRVYGVTSLLSFISQRLDVLCLGVLLGAAATGVYNVSYRLVFFLMLLSHQASQSVFPLASRLFLESRDELRLLYRRSVRTMILACLPAAVGLALIADDVIPSIYTTRFLDSVPILQLLTIALFAACVRTVVDVFMLACDLQEARTRLRWVTVVLNLGGNLALIPYLGIVGAAISTVVAECVLTASEIVRLRPLLGWPRVGSRLLIAGAATATFYLALQALPPLSLFVVIPACAAIYGVSLLAFPSFRRDEGSMLSELMRDR